LVLFDLEGDLTTKNNGWHLTIDKVVRTCSL